MWKINAQLLSKRPFRISYQMKKLNIVYKCIFICIGQSEIDYEASSLK